MIINRYYKEKWIVGAYKELSKENAYLYRIFEGEINFPEEAREITMALSSDPIFPYFLWGKEKSFAYIFNSESEAFRQMNSARSKLRNARLRFFLEELK